MNLNSIFDTINNVTNDPQFQTGIGLMGAARPSNPSMMQAFQVLQAMRENRAQQERQAQEAAYRQAQAAQAQEHSKLYAQQVAEQKRKMDLRERQLSMVEPLLRSTMQQAGIGGGTGIPAPVMPNQQAAPMQPQSSMQPPANPIFDQADSFIAEIEGGYVPNDGGKGPTNYGINQFANPDINVKNLTPETAAQIRKQRYWDKLPADLPRETALVAYDASINQGQEYAKNLLDKTGGDPALMLYQRREDYRKLAASSPIHAKSLKGWEDRLNKLQSLLKTPTASAQPEQEFDMPGADPSRALLMAAGAIQATGDDPAEGIKTIAGALKPEVFQPGSFVRQGGRLTRVPNPEEQQRLANERKRLAYEGTRVTQEAQRVQQGERRIRIDEAGESRQQTEATRKTKTAQAADFGQVQGVLDNTTQLTDVAANLMTSPALGRITGLMSLAPTAPGTPAANAKADLDALGSKILLSTITALKSLSANGSTGFGQLSNIEGEHLKNSVASLKESQSEKQMRERLSVVIKASNDVVDRAVEVYERTHDASPYEGLPVGTRQLRDPKTGAQARSKNGLPLLRLPNGKLVEVRK